MVLLGKQLYPAGVWEEQGFSLQGSPRHVAFLLLKPLSG